MAMKRKWLFLSGAVLLVLVILAFTVHRNQQTEYLTAKVEHGDIMDAVDATGSVNAVTTVQVGSQVSGTIAKLNADFNSHVQRGDVIALIEPALFKGALQQAVADSQNAEANLAAAQANLEKAKANLEQAQADYDRTVTLAKDALVAQQQLEISRATNDGAKASVNAAAANVLQARAQVSQKSAAVSVARTNLNYTVIRSPIDGIVVARNVDVGQTVAASLQAPTIFTIAQDLAKMQVYGKVDESDVGRVKVGQPVTFRVDAFPKQVFSGAVSQIRMNPTVVQNVVTYDAIIDFANPEMKLFPGMTAYVSIPVATADNVIKVPDAALRYRPSLSPEDVHALYQKVGIDNRDVDHGPAEAHAGTSMERPNKPSRGVASAPPARPPSDSPAGTAIVWKLEGGSSIRPVEIGLGITDHAFTAVTAVLHGELKEGDELVTRSLLTKSTSPTGQGIRR
jgi:HlyD family secretion protein